MPTYTTGRTIIGRVERGEDLLAAIARVANDEKIRVASVSVSGVLERGGVTHFDPATRMQQRIDLEEGGEIASMTGTITQFKGRSMPRLSGVIVRPDGSMAGGLLSIGSTAFACEVVITEHEGSVLSRDFDPDTGLPLWKGSSQL